jgi:hypothetical protein
MSKQKRHDLNEVKALLIQAKNLISGICMEIYQDEIDFDDVIMSISSKTNIELSDQAKEIFDVANELHSIIVDISDAQINNAYIASDIMPDDRVIDSEEHSEEDIYGV